MKTSKCIFLSLLLLAAVSLADGQAGKKKTQPKSANPTTGSPTTFTLDVDQMYCDESLPYSYHSDAKGLTLTVGESQDEHRNPAAWADVLRADWSKLVDASTLPTPNFSDAQSFPSGEWNDPPVEGPKDDLSKHPLFLNDNGRPILFDPNWELSDTTYDAQRLLVRTLFGPNPFQVACAYPYLKYPDGNVATEPLHQGADGQSISLLSKGSGYALSLNAKDAPKYYLINIVRWKDATPPKDSSATPVAKLPAAGSAPVPFFQAASDDWYLLNYSDAQDRHQDITGLFRKITPTLMSDTLRIIGSDKVMFLGIHLAPLPALDATAIPNPNSNSAPATEQAWFDAITLKYTFQASAATPTNMADLQTLFSILLGSATKGAVSNKTSQATTAETEKFQPAPSPPPPATLGVALKQLNSAIDEANNVLGQYTALDLFLRGFQVDLKVQHYGIESGPNATSALLKVTQIENSVPSVVQISLDSSVNDKLTSLSNADLDKDTSVAANQATALAAVQQDIDELSQLQASAKAAASQTPVLSTYQGKYAAGLLTNLKNLPVTLASNWSATFVALPDLKEWAGNAGIYDLTKPGTSVADKSNRAGITCGKADVLKKNVAKCSESSTDQGTASGNGSGSISAQTLFLSARSTHSSFGPSPEPGFNLLLGPYNEQLQDSTQPANSSTGQDSGKPTDKSGKGKSSPGKNAAAGTDKTKDAATSPKNNTTAASTICTVGLTKGKTTDNPQTLQHQSDCSDQQTKILDEGREWWDISFIVPVTGYQDLTFQSSSANSSGSSATNIIAAKSVTRENAYGVADIFLVPEDLIDRPYIGIPHVVVGLPFSGKVFDKPYFAIGETINFPKMLAKVPGLRDVPLFSNLAQRNLPLFVRPVFGWVYNKVSPANGASSYRVFKPQWAIEMSFSSIKDAVSTFGKKSSKGSGNTTKQTTPSAVPDSN
jgi:hypothetical protein